MKRTSAAQELGCRGGRARAARLTAGERRAIASLGGKARSLSHHAARRIAENFRYLEAMDALRKARPAVVRMRWFDGTLPGTRSRTDRNGRGSR